MRPDAVVRDAAGEVVVLVGGDHEQRVGLVDPIVLQPVEEGTEGVVVGLQRRDVVGLARADARGKTPFGSDGAGKAFVWLS